MDALAGGYRPTDDKDGVVSTNGAEYVTPTLAVEGSRNGLGAAGHRAQNEHLTDAVDAQKQLWQQGIEGGSALLDISVRDRVTRALGCRHPGEPQLTQIAGKSCLRYIPAAL